MKTLLTCALMASALLLSSSAMAEDGFDQTPLARQISQHDDSADGGSESERFAETLERQPTAAGRQPESEESESRQHRKRSGSYDHQ
nr:hypothetical protein [uncultured Pseudomonas sp.]